MKTDIPPFNTPCFRFRARLALSDFAAAGEAGSPSITPHERPVDAERLAADGWAAAEGAGQRHTCLGWWPPGCPGDSSKALPPPSWVPHTQEGDQAPCSPLASVFSPRTWEQRNHRTRLLEAKEDGLVRGSITAGLTLPT